MKRTLLSESEKRNNSVTVSINDIEYDRVYRAAKNARLPMSQFIRGILMRHLDWIEKKKGAGKA